jgi:hypothetical protein
MFRQGDFGESKANIKPEKAAIEYIINIAAKAALVVNG